MLKFENTHVDGFAAAVRGMRNPLNSWAKSDSFRDDLTGAFIIGENDMGLMKRLNGAHREESKFMRMINVSFDVTAPRYWWTEFDTYGFTVRNSCSTMHKILSRPLTLDDFSREGLPPEADFALQEIIRTINRVIETRLPTATETLLTVKKLLPESYLQRATISTNYEVIRAMYTQRKNHRLPEWNTDFVEWVESLPYAKELIIE